MTVTAQEFRWREWLLGEGEFKGKGQKSQPRPDFPLPIEKEWWARLEEFLARRSDHAEPGLKHDNPLSNPLVPASTSQLTPHFNVREFDCHNGARVPDRAVPALKRLCEVYLEPMRAKFGQAHVLSGYRPEEYNKNIGGATFSQHIYELSPDAVAADTTYASGKPADWAAHADHLGAGGVGRYDGSGFVHIDNRPGPARWTG
jgi:hypothetical protein